MRIRFLMTIFAVVLTACSSAFGPSRAELENKFKVDMPSIWTLTSFKVTAEENQGTPTQPDVRARFVATVVLAQDLYKLQERLLDKPVLAKTKSAGDMKLELHGIARSRLNGGRWNVEFDVENDRKAEALGKPLSDYDDYVLAGSPEEKALRDEAAKQAEADRKEQEVLQKARAEALRIDQERAKTVEQATAAMFSPGARLVSRYNDIRTQKSGAFVLVIEKHDPMTRTFSGEFRNDKGDVDVVEGSYDGPKVAITEKGCRYLLTATGGNPMLRGAYSGSPLGGCGQGGTIEVGFR